MITDISADPPAVAHSAIPDLPPPGRLAYHTALAVVVMIAVVVFAGALVTSTNSGMAFRTWPDADGAYLWPANPTLSGILEHSHRLIAVVLGLTTMLLVFLVFHQDRRPRSRRLVLILLAMVIVQGLLGGFRIRLDDQFPRLYPILHGTLAPVVFSLGAYVAFAISTQWVPRSTEDAGRVRTQRRLVVFALAVLFVQVFLGVVLRHTNSNPAKWAHVFVAFVAGLAVLVAVGHCMGKFGGHQGFNRLNRTILIVLAGQIVLGFIALGVRRPKHLTDTNLMGKATLISLHVVLGGALLLLVTLMLARSYRNLAPRVEA